ncbi:uncharacterized protein LOC141655538 [Silene latifolia]|uniref:uncharacterized protein LOC141655538 n=1 Tax=Silene latifolia TaxID=37657 RepID=UPI003D770D8B
MGWLMAREAMQVKEKLFALGICQDDTCLFCGNASESHKHLFVECLYSRRILMGMAKLCKISLPSGDVLQWVWQHKWSQAKKGVLLYSFMSCYYYIWKQRNRVRCEQVLLHPDVVVKQLQQVVKMRVDAVSNQILGIDRIWLSNTGLCK